MIVKELFVCLLSLTPCLDLMSLVFLYKYWKDFYTHAMQNVAVFLILPI